MKICAKLIGNYKIYEIKSSYNNKLMTLLADEELIGVIPRVDTIVNNEWKDIGWYIDEKGIRRHGVIPKGAPQALYKPINSYDPSRIRSSRPMYY